MLNPFNPQQDSGPSSYVELKKRMLKKVQSTGVNDQIFQAVQNAFENALNSERPIILLSRPERKRLFSQVLRSVLENMVQKLDERSSRA